LKKLYGKLIYFLAQSAIYLVVGLCSSTPAVAASSLIVNGVLLVTEVSEGESLNHKIIISVNESEGPIDVIAEVGGINQASDGTLQFIPLDSNNDYSAREYITLDHNILHLQPNIPQEITVKIRIPENAGDGGRYALINLKTITSNKGTLNTASAINVPVFLTIKDSNIIESAQIENLITSEVVTGQPVNIITKFKNTGNHHFKVKGEVRITNPEGRIVGSVYSTLTNSIIPMMTREMKSIFIPEEKLEEGIYSIQSKLMLDNGAILDMEQSQFEVKKEYQLPPAPASQTIIPSNFSSLKSKDARISINFPVGSVIEPVLITLRDYPLEQLPPLSKELGTGTTCFRVDGLNGLLTKEALITVRYTEDDLEKAEGNPNRLRLAYWNEGENRWFVLKTAVDINNMTLTTSTNHFSIWAVIVAPEQKLSLPLVFGIVIGGCFIIGLFIWYLIKKKDRFNKQDILH
jgi:hypothetical protein